MLIKDGIARIGVEVNTIFDLAFMASILKCSFIFTPFAYEHNGSKYHTLKLVRDKYEDKDSGD